MIPTSYVILIQDDEVVNTIDEVPPVDLTSPQSSQLSFHGRLDKEGLWECPKCKLYFTKENALKHQSLDHSTKWRRNLLLQHYVSSHMQPLLNLDERSENSSDVQQVQKTEGGKVLASRHIFW